MSKRSGWVKLHREALDGWLFQLPDRQFKVAMVCLLAANWKRGTTISGGRPVIVERGQFMTSLDSLSKMTRIKSIQVIRTSLTVLERVGFLTSRPTSRHRIITITNYDRYQDRDDAANKPANTSLTSQQQAANNDRRREEGKKGRSNTDRAPRFDFESVYKLYPKKAAKKAGMGKAKKTVKTDADYTLLSKAVATMAKAWEGQDKTYCPGWGPFMNQELWRDDDLPAPSQASMDDRYAPPTKKPLPEVIKPRKR